MEIKRSGSQPSSNGPADWFTGNVRIDPLFGGTGTGTCAWRKRHVRAGCTHRLAHTSFVETNDETRMTKSETMSTLRPCAYVVFSSLCLWLITIASAFAQETICPNLADNPEFLMLVG